VYLLWIGYEPYLMAAKKILLWYKCISYAFVCDNVLFLTDNLYVNLPQFCKLSYGFHEIQYKNKLEISINDNLIFGTKHDHSSVHDHRRSRWLSPWTPGWKERTKLYFPANRKEISNIRELTYRKPSTIDSQFSWGTPVRTRS